MSYPSLGVIGLRFRLRVPSAQPREKAVKPEGPPP